MFTMFFKVSVYFFIQVNWNGTRVSNKELACDFIGRKIVIMKETLVVSLEEVTCIYMYLWQFLHFTLRSMSISHFKSLNYKTLSIIEHNDKDSIMWTFYFTFITSIKENDVLVVSGRNFIFVNIPIRKR